MRYSYAPLDSSYFRQRKRKQKDPLRYADYLPAHSTTSENVVQIALLAANSRTSREHSSPDVYSVLCRLRLVSDLYDLVNFSQLT